MMSVQIVLQKNRELWSMITVGVLLVWLSYNILYRPYKTQVNCNRKENSIELHLHLPCGRHAILEGKLSKFTSIEARKIRNGGHIIGYDVYLHFSNRSSIMFHTTDALQTAVKTQQSNEPTSPRNQTRLHQIAAFTCQPSTPIFKESAIYQILFCISQPNLCLHFICVVLIASAYVAASYGIRELVEHVSKR